MATHGTAIEWTHVPGYKGETWNPTTGCDQVSPGCAHCYAEEFAERWRGIPGHAYEQGFDLKLHPGRLDMPERWHKPRAVFVNSMSDLFHERIPAEYIATVFGRMAATPRHIFMVLTKRPERMVELLQHPEFDNTMRRASGQMGHELPLPNVWLGVSIENRRFVHRADLLRETPAAVRFISAEPLLGPLLCDSTRVDAGRQVAAWADGHDGPDIDLSEIDWLIVGGESGPHNRPPDPDWVRALRDFTVMLQRSGIRRPPAFFFKQWGGLRPHSNGRLLDGRTYDEFPSLSEERAHA